MKRKDLRVSLTKDEYLTVWTLICNWLDENSQKAEPKTVEEFKAIKGKLEDAW